MDSQRSRISRPDIPHGEIRLPSVEPAPVEYVTATQVNERWPDVRAPLLRLWVHRGLLDVVRDLDGHPVRAKGGASIYRWHEVVAAERRARETPAGRPRFR